MKSWKIPYIEEKLNVKEEEKPQIPGVPDITDGTAGEVDYGGSLTGILSLARSQGLIKILTPEEKGQRGGLSEEDTMDCRAKVRRSSPIGATSVSERSRRYQRSGTARSGKSDKR